MDVAGYYADLTQNYLYYGGDANSWHYGVWEEDVETVQDSLVRSNELLCRGLQLNASSRILDVGCGNGGLAVWAAKRFGCKATGITICAEHVAIAEQLAVDHEVDGLCDFHAMDMDSLDFPDASFDVVFNQETLCHSADKSGYIEAVHRVLRPNGVWRSIVFLLAERALSVPETESYEEIRTGWHIPNLPTNTDVLTMLGKANFKQIEAPDITSEVQPCARIIKKQCRLPLLAAHLHLDWLVYTFEPRMRANRRGHIRASIAYSDGLLDGFIRHGSFSAQKI